ncbi:IMP dehydrogenase, partial [Salmonella enterica subsp. enterica serovar Typhimurium]
EYVTTPVHETLEQLVETHQTPVYVVHFSQAAALERAQALIEEEVDCLFLDSSHGHSHGVIEMVRRIKSRYAIPLIAGN